MPTLASVWDEATHAAAPIRRVVEYRGEASVAIEATQLEDAGISRAEATRIVADWIELFRSGPSPIEELRFVSRTPKRLFASLAGQTQLRRLYVKWGDYDDLSALAPLRSLTVLRLGGASSVRDVAPLAALAETLTHLEIESLRHAHDLSPLGALTGLRVLELGGDWMSPRNAHVDTIGWLPQLHRLEHLLLHTVIVDDLDYTPLLHLPRLRAVRVKPVRGMRPSHEELQARLPWAG